MLHSIIRGRILGIETNRKAIDGLEISGGWRLTIVLWPSAEVYPGAARTSAICMQELTFSLGVSAETRLNDRNALVNCPSVELL